MNAIPERGRTAAPILATLQSYKTHDIPWRDGRVMAYVYHAGDEAEQLIKAANNLYLSENGLDPTTFPSLLRLEREVVRMVATMLHGDEQVVGNVSSGGTESIMLAVKTARDWARAERGITEPEMILSRTAHVAFHKAAHYLGVKLVFVPYDRETYETVAAAIPPAITANTILLVASAPNYSHGVIDPIAEMAAIAQAHNILCHVDACIGGFQLTYMRQLGYPVPAFDFAVPGVTSLSVDVHKYGYGAKGASVILYRSKALRRYQIYANLSTTAYAIINPTVQSTKSGGPVAAAWAILNFMGNDGYRRVIGATAQATAELIAGIKTMPDLHIVGQPAMCLLAIESDTLNVFQLADQMKKRGWYIQPQFSPDSDRPNVHLSLTVAFAPHVATFLADLQTCVDEVKQLDPLDPGPVKALIEQMLGERSEQLAVNSELSPISSLSVSQSPTLAQQLLALGGLEGTTLPEEMALVNTLLAALPTAVAEAVLQEFFNELYS